MLLRARRSSSATIQFDSFARFSAIDRAAALDQMGQDGTAVLHQALATCRMQGEPGALLQARLMELQ